MSKNCPYCPLDTPNERWGMSPEGWRNAKEVHDREHCVKCPTCGQLSDRYIRFRNGAVDLNEN